MATLRNYKAYLKKEIERIEKCKSENKYTDISSANREIQRIKSEMKRKDRKKMGDISCEIIADNDIYPLI